MLHGILMSAALMCLSGVTIVIYEITIENKPKRNFGKWFGFSFIVFLIAYFVESILCNSGFIEALSQFCITAAIAFGIILPIIALLFKGEKKMMGVIMSFIAIPFVLICLILSFFGVIHWLFPVLYFAIPTCIFFTFIIKERVEITLKKKNCTN